MAALLQLLEQVVQAAAEHGAGCAAGEQAAQPALEQVAEARRTPPAPGMPAVTVPPVGRAGGGGGVGAGPAGCRR